MWARALVLIFLAAAALFLTLQFRSFHDAASFLAELNRNTGQLLLWLLALVGAAALVVGHWQK